MLETYASSAALAQAAAAAAVENLSQALDLRGRASLVATGGRAPGPVYDLLRDARIDWARVVVTLSDERCVAPDAPEANARLLRERLLVGDAARAGFLPLWPTPPEAALKSLAPFDAVLLGMGEDGHVASLIPGSPVLPQGLDLTRDDFLLAVPPGTGSPPLARISLTLTALLQSRAIFLLIAGEAKRQVIDRAMSGDDLPVRHILRQTQVPVRVLWAPQH